MTVIALHINDVVVAQWLSLSVKVVLTIVGVYPLNRFGIGTVLIDNLFVAITFIAVAVLAAAQ